MLDAQRALSQVLDSCTLAQMRMMAGTDLKVVNYDI
jgi:hypothetical protein